MCTLTLTRVSPRYHALACVILLLVSFMIPSQYRLFTYAESVDAPKISAVGVSSGDILITLKNGTIYEAHVSEFNAFSTLMINESIILSFGTFKGYPATLLLVVNHAYQAIILYTSVGKGALFSGITRGKKFDVTGVGYVTLNNTYAGIVMHVNLSNMNSSSYIYVFNIPTYFRDILFHNDIALIATGTGLSGRYYPALTVISGNDARLITLSPSIGGLEGFTVKAVVPLPRSGYAVLAMRENKAMLVQLTGTGKELQAYTLFTGKEFTGVALITHPDNSTTTVILNSTTPLAISFPHMNATTLPLASRYYLVSTNGSFIILGPKFRKLLIHRKTFHVNLKESTLEGFNVAKYFTKGRYSSVLTASASVFTNIVRSPIPATSYTSTQSGSLSNSKTHLTHVPTVTTGFALIVGNEEKGLLLIIIGCILVFASFLLKKLLDV